VKEAYLFSIQRFSLNDGPGIRTTFFVSGCPLRCRWCHNPEGLSGKALIAYHDRKCVRCRACEAICPENAHFFGENGVHRILRDRCAACGTCLLVCHMNAVERYGQLMTSDEVCVAAAADTPFYKKRGGVTFSGGEALLHADFVAECARKIKEQGIAPTVAIDTCGHVPYEAIEAVLNYTDYFLYDIKAATPEIHLAATGVSNERILSNLARLDRESAGKAKIWIRVPVIPGVNSSVEEMKKIADIVQGLRNAEKTTLMPYHSLGSEKYRLFDMEYGFDSTLKVSEEELAAYKALFADRGILVAD